MILHVFDVSIFGRLQMSLECTTQFIFHTLGWCATCYNECFNPDKFKEKIVFLWSIGIIVIKEEKQGWSPTPADILVDNLIPNFNPLAEL